MTYKSRRKFLRQSVGLTSIGASTFLGTTRAIGSQKIPSSGVLGSNNKILVGVIGCGGRGRRLLTHFLQNKNVRCVALCDIDDQQILQTSQLDQSISTSLTLKTKDFRNVLDLKDLDAVIVATPDHWHALQTVMACQLNKDVFVEKPLALTIREGRFMVQAARRYKRVVQVGTQQRSTPHFADAIKYVHSGQLGRIRLVRAWAYLDWKGHTPKVSDSSPPPHVDYDMWLGPAKDRPFNKNRFHFTFRWFWDYSGGLMTDWGAHMIDIANWGMNVKAPSSAFSAGGKFAYPDDAMETPDTQQATWSFPDFTMIWEHALGVGRGPESREHGVSFHGEEGLLVVDRLGWQVFSETKKGERRKRIFKGKGLPLQPAQKGSTLRHVNNFLDCMDSRKRPNADVEIAHNSVIGCHLANIAQRLAREVKWDVNKEEVVNDPEAQTMILFDYRSPWKLST